MCLVVGVQPLRAPTLLDAVDGGITVPAKAWREIKAHRRAVKRREFGIDPLDGHKFLCQLKIAAALMRWKAGNTRLPNPTGSALV